MKKEIDLHKYFTHSGIHRHSEMIRNKGRSNYNEYCNVYVYCMYGSVCVRVHVCVILVWVF